MKWDGRIVANSLHIPLADASVHCVITSPPYWNLRKYNVGDEQLGQESTIEEYLDNMGNVFAEVWRVLRPEGTLWLNMGDGFAQSGGTGAQGSTSQRVGRSNVNAQEKPHSQKPPIGLKAKDLIGMPWRLAFALQAAGWYLRSDIVWHKKNTMPESVNDRPTRAHEFIFLLTKQPRYFYDVHAIKERASDDTHARYARGRNPSDYPGAQTIANTMEHMAAKQDGHGRRHAGFNERYANKQREAGVHPKSAPAGSGIRQNESFSAAVKDVVGMRNKRDVWSLGSASYPEAHYATFPLELIEPPLLAGTSAHGCCSKCGAPYIRQVEPSAEYAKYLGTGFHDHENDDEQGLMQNRGENRQNQMRDETGNHCADYVTTGWKASCSCQDHIIVPCTVMDPFFGSGTVGECAEQWGRRWIGLDLGYQEMQGRRISNVQRELFL